MIYDRRGYFSTYRDGSSTFTHFIIGHQTKGDRGHVEGIGEKVDDVPHVVDVLFQSHVPKLLDFAPYQAYQEKTGVKSHT